MNLHKHSESFKDWSAIIRINTSSVIIQLN